MNNNYCTIHPQDPQLPEEFFYGNMKVKRKELSDNSKVARQVESIVGSYIDSGILPHQSELTGDYLEHFLIRPDKGDERPAGRYAGIRFCDDTYQYLRLDGERIGVSKSEMGYPEEIIVLTDTCLFCTANAYATLINGEKISIVAPQTKIELQIDDINVSDRLCPYEIDSILRLTDLINAISQNNLRIKGTVLAMPTVEYYFYLMGAYNKGLVKASSMLEWIKKVQLHSQKIIKAIGKRLNMKVTLCQPLQYVELYLHSCIEKNDKVEYDKVIEILSNSDDLWRQVLLITQPKEWRDLNYVNYAMAVLFTARCESEENKLVIDIENPSEQRILRNTANIVHKLRNMGNTDKFCAIGMYPHEKVFFSPSGQCNGVFPRMYYVGEEILTSGKLFREIIEANRRKLVS